MFHSVSTKRRILGIAIPLFISGVGIGAYTLTHMETVPYFDRRRVVIKKEAIDKVSESIFTSLSKKFLPMTSSESIYVNFIAKEILKVCGAEQFNYDWKFAVFPHYIPNAFGNSKGQVVVFSSLLDVLDRDEVASVVAHEIAHVLIGHAYELVSKSLFSQVLLTIKSSIGLNPSKPGDMYVEIALISSQAKLYPNRKKSELEADELGLMLMSRAGFNPQAMVSAYAKFEKIYAKHNQGGDTDIPERIENMKKFLSEAKEQRKIYAFTNNPPEIQHWYTGLPKKSH